MDGGGGYELPGRRQGDYEKGTIDATGARIYGRKVNVPDHYVVELQRDLQTFGCAPGAADGFFGNRTDDALRAFQEGALGHRRTMGGKDVTVTPTFIISTMEYTH